MKNNHRWTQEEAALFVELWQSAMDAAEIGVKLGIKTKAALSFAGWLRRKGVPLRRRPRGGILSGLDFTALKAIVSQEERQ